MHTTDLEGRKIEITDIGGSLDLVAGFLTYINNHPLPSLQRLEDRRLHYWQDIYTKLLNLLDRFYNSLP